MKVKCVIWDLDNTIWNGILKKDKRVELKPQIINVLQELYERGMIQTIVSKNYKQETLKKMRDLKIDKYFVFPQVSYNPKSIMIKKILDFVNVDEESVAFIDDDDFELNEIKKVYPNMKIYSADEYLCILDYEEFKTNNINDSGGERTKYLKIKEKRVKDEQNFNGIKEEFMKNANTTLIIRKYKTCYLERIFELIYRTNKYNNLDKSGFNKEDIINYSKNKDSKILIIEMKDRYGYYGIIGTLFYKIVNKTMFIDILSISCRILGRGIAISILSSIINKLFNENKIEQVKCMINYTKKNRESIVLLNLLMFKLNSKNEQLLEFVLNKKIKIENTEFVSVFFKEDI